MRLQFPLQIKQCKLYIYSKQSKGRSFQMLVLFIFIFLMIKLEQMGSQLGHYYFMFQFNHQENKNQHTQQVYSVFPMMKGNSPRRVKTDTIEKQKFVPASQILDDQRQFLSRMKRAKELILCHRRRKFQTEQKNNRKMIQQEKSFRQKSCGKMEGGQFSQVVYKIDASAEKTRKNKEIEDDRLRQCQSQFMQHSLEKAGKIKARQKLKTKGLEDLDYIINETRQFQPLSKSVNISLSNKGSSRSSKQKNKNKKFLERNNEEESSLNLSPKLKCKKVELYLSLTGQELEVTKQFPNRFPPFNSSKIKQIKVQERQHYQHPFKNYKIVKKLKPIKYCNQNQEDEEQQLQKKTIQDKRNSKVLRQRMQKWILPDLQLKLVEQKQDRKQINLRKQYEKSFSTDFVLEGWVKSEATLEDQ